MQHKLFIALLVLAALAFLAGCGHNASNTPAVGGQNAPQASATQSGAQLWADNCARCHNMRPPPSYSDAQWQAVVHHMRLRANLTGGEARSITAFLQASN